MFFTSIGSAYLYNLNGEIFPTRIRGFTFSVALAFGRILSALTPFVIDFANSLGVHPLTFVLITSLIALPFLHLLPETKDKKLDN